MNLSLIRRAPRWQAAGNRSLRGRIGIDIGAHSIKCIQVCRTGGVWQLGKHCRIELNQDCEQNADGATSLVQSVVQAVRQHPRLRRLFAGRRAACTLPMSLVQHRSLQMPHATRDEMRDLLREELASDGQLEAREFDWWQADDRGAAQDAAARVAVVSLPTAVASELAQCLTAAGFDCETLDSLPTTLARAAVLAEGRHDHEATALVDLGHSTPMMTFVVHGTAVFSRQLPDCGLRHLHAALVGPLGISPQESGRLLSHYDMTAVEPARSELQSAMQQLAVPFLRQLVTQLDRTLAYVQQHYRHAFPHHIWLCGGGGVLPGLDAYLTEQLNHPVERWRIASPSPAPAEPGLQPLLAAAIALSLIDEVD